MKKLTAITVLLVVAMFAFAACNRTADQPAPGTGDQGGQQAQGGQAAQGGQEATAGGTVYVLMPSLPTTLDPVGPNIQPASQVNVQIYETLFVQVGSEAVITPLLAESYSFDNPAALRIQLRQGVYFHNGERFTAEDAAFSIMRSVESPHSRAMIDMVSSVDVIGEYEIVVNTYFPFAPIISHLTHPAISMVSRAAVEHYGEDDFGANPVGSGPFRFVNHAAGDRIELTRFDGYWGAAPAYENLTFRMVPEAANRLIEVQTGHAHIAYGISATDVPVAEGDARVNLVRQQTFSLTYLGFNTTKAPFDDVRVRQAIAYAIDLPTIIDAVWLGVGAPGSTVIAETVWSSHPGIDMRQQNLDRARELLAEAGHPNGFDSILWTNTGNAQRADLVEILGAQLRQVGINVTIELLEFNIFTERMESPDHHEMFVIAWGTVTNDPDYGMFNLFHSSAFGAAGNRMFYANPTVDALLEEGRMETNEARRLQIYHEIQEILFEELPWISIWQGEDLFVTAVGVEGFVALPAGHHRLASVILP